VKKREKGKVRVRGCEVRSRIERERERKQGRRSFWFTKSEILERERMGESEKRTKGETGKRER